MLRGAFDAQGANSHIGRPEIIINPYCRDCFMPKKIASLHVVFLHKASTVNKSGGAADRPIDQELDRLGIKPIRYMIT